ncbi:MAG: kynureninase [Deltaproteobacteria bacterium]|nr:kynureninase [Deltaproteobacteria bacterium]
MQGFTTDEAFAAELDAADPLAPLRERFHVPPETVYLLGNSLGLQSRDAEQAVTRAMGEWRDRAIGGWLDADPPWFWLAERLGARAAKLVGAEPDEVVCTGTTTYNVHSLAATFYRPSGRRTRILGCALEFPTDLYALGSQLRLHGLDPREHLALVGAADDGFVREDELIARMTGDVALVVLPTVLYRSGQLLDVARLAAAARDRGIPIGFDGSHSVGVVPHRFDEWGVDFALWCGYKYLCGGPGAPAFLYVARRHFDRGPGLAGWFGCVKERQFDLAPDFEHARCAGGWQVSSPGILGAAAVDGALAVLEQAGVERVREKSLRLTEYLIRLVDARLADAPYDFRVATPREPQRRGGHVALTREADALRIKEALAPRGVVCDFRPPDTIRLAPSPLYTSFRDVHAAVRHLREVIDGHEHERIDPHRRAVS